MSNKKRDSKADAKEAIYSALRRDDVSGAKTIIIAGKANEKGIILKGRVTQVFSMKDAVEFFGVDSELFFMIWGAFAANDKLNVFALSV